MSGDDILKNHRDLSGSRFGRLRAVEAMPEKIHGAVMWSCECDCGNMSIVSEYSLLSGKTRSCGCLQKELASKAAKKKTADLVGRRFGRLTVQRLSETRKYGVVTWQCLCDCGSTIDVTANDLISGHRISCGCAKKDYPGNVSNLEEARERDYTDGTCLHALNASIPKNNTSGVKGVSFQKETGKWRAYITLGRKQMHLGLFDTLEDASKVRKQAEERYFDPILEANGRPSTEKKHGRGKTADLRGKRFGKLVAIEPTDQRRHGYIVWRCKCDCGNEAFVERGSLVSGRTSSCGCLRGGTPMHDLTGQRFGRLLAIEPTDQRRHGHIVWRCMCDCGNEAFVERGSLVSGGTKSCGCLRGGAPMHDLTGQRFGRLLAIEPTDQRRHGYIVWRCKCDCGNEAFVERGSLVSGGTKSCGCLHRGVSMNDLTGRRFGRLLAIEPTEQRRNSYIVWRCKCDCGNEAFVESGSLVSGGTSSCGCLRGGAPMHDLTGQRFGRLLAIEPTDQRRHGYIVWRCMCDCGNEAFVESGSLVSGGTKSCGCLRGGKRERGIAPIHDLTGRRFGRLLAIEPTDQRRHGYIVWRCKCDCGNEAFVMSGNLVSGNTKSCGCLRKRQPRCGRGCAEA